ncbi:hypothetical protein KEM54_000079 [Ascosphaera aggregata]|nr:hypothetical protein KEM54_000079 [Ascosphaera aggregata]
MRDDLVKEYFSKSAGPVKKVILTYNQNGTSRGIASIIFKQPESAAKAAKNLNGMLVDKKPIKIEVVVDPTKVQTAAVPAVPKSLAQRATQPKSAQPNKAAAAPKANAGTAGRAGRGRRGRHGRPNRPKPKTAEELDQEMTDYFVRPVQAMLIMLLSEPTVKLQLRTRSLPLKETIWEWKIL